MLLPTWSTSIREVLGEVRAAALLSNPFLSHHTLTCYSNLNAISGLENSTLNSCHMCVSTPLRTNDMKCSDPHMSSGGMYVLYQISLAWQSNSSNPGIILGQTYPFQVWSIPEHLSYTGSPGIILELLNPPAPLWPSIPERRSYTGSPGIILGLPNPQHPCTCASYRIKLCCKLPIAYWCSC